MECKCGMLSDDKFIINFCEKDKPHDIPQSATKLVISNSNYSELNDLPNTIIELTILACQKLQKITEHHLKKIVVISCYNLVDIDVPSTMISMCIDTCKKLKKIELSSESKLRFLSVINCNDLTEITGLNNVLGKIEIENCKSIYKIEATNDCLQEEDFFYDSSNLLNCPKLVLMPCEWRAKPFFNFE